MEIWDDKMQNECALSFQREEVIMKMTLQNLQKLAEECLNIILNANIENEEVLISCNLSQLITQWVKVFKILVVYLPLDFIKASVIKRIVDLPTLK